MVEHLTQKQFEDYRQQQLQVAELLSVSDHLGECETCRRRLERAADGDAAFFALRSEVFGEAAETSSAHPDCAHLTAEQTALYVDGGLSGRALRTVADHLTLCERCTLAVDDLREFRDEIAPTLGREYQPAALPSPVDGWWRRTAESFSTLLRVSPRPAFGAAVAVLLLAATVWLVWRTPRRGEPNQELAGSPSPASRPASVVVPPSPAYQPAPVAPQTETVPVVAQLNDAESLVTLDRKGRLSGAEGLPPAYQRMLKGALTGRRIERSPYLNGLARPQSSLMGADERLAEFSVIEPVGNVLLTDRPTFRWSPMEGATGYVVEVYDGKFNLVVSSPQLTGRSWAPPQSLSRGAAYSWQVKAVKDGEEVTSPRPPAPQARFRILDRAKANELARARRAYPSSHLTLGLLYADAGLLQEAEQELRILQKANPRSDIARSLLRQVRALRRRSG